MGPIVKAIPVITGLLGIGSGIMEYKDSKKAAAEQERMAALNASNIERETKEDQRRAARAELERRGTSLARQGASGGAAGGSMSLWEQEQQNEFDKQMAWLYESSSSRQDIARAKGRTAATQTKAAGRSSLWGGISGGVGDLYKGGKIRGWWS